jgi:hypothetical protein
MIEHPEDNGVRCFALTLAFLMIVMALVTALSLDDIRNRLTSLEQRLDAIEQRGRK